VGNSEGKQAVFHSAQTQLRRKPHKARVAIVRSPSGIGFAEIADGTEIADWELAHSAPGFANRNPQFKIENSQGA
jgi:hypothetical protein